MRHLFEHAIHAEAPADVQRLHVRGEREENQSDNHRVGTSGEM